VIERGRRRTAKRELDWSEMDEPELVAELRRRSWSWLTGERAAVVEVEADRNGAAAAVPEAIAEPTPPPKKPRGKRASVPPESASAQAAPSGRKPRAGNPAAFRRGAWQWLKPRVSLRATPANDAEPLPKKKRAKKEVVPEGVLALRKNAWQWMKARAKVVALAAKAAEKEKAAAEKAAEKAAAAKPAAPVETEAPKKKRAKKEVVPEGVLALRRNAWAWFAPKATGEAAAGTHAPLRAVSPTAAVPGGEVVRSHLKGVLEALIFASEHPLPAKELARIAQADLKLVKTLLGELVEEYHHRGFRLDEVANGYVFRTSPVFAPFVREQVQKKPVKMTRAQIETLAIVAYRQPITRPEIDEVRGVDSGAVLKSLLERELVRIIGKKDEPGRPMLYGTTGSFLEFFGLKSLGDLPTLREFTELTDESRRAYEREMGEEPPDGSTPIEGGLMGGEGELRAPAAPVDPKAFEEMPPDIAGDEVTASPEALTAGPEALTAGPEALTAGPEALTAGPEALTADPEAVADEPEAVADEPEAVAEDGDADEDDEEDEDEDEEDDEEDEDDEDDDEDDEDEDEDDDEHEDEDDE
jgi:segregation and condensation protein B